MMLSRYPISVLFPFTYSIFFNEDIKPFIQESDIRHALALQRTYVNFKRIQNKKTFKFSIRTFDLQDYHVYIRGKIPDNSFEFKQHIYYKAFELLESKLSIINQKQN